MNGAVTHYLTYVGLGKTLALLGGLDTDTYNYIGIGDALEDHTYDAFSMEHEWDRAVGAVTFDDANRHGILTASFTGFVGTVGVYQAGIFDQADTEPDAILGYHYVNTTPFQNLTSADTYTVALEMGFDTTTSDQITNAGLTEAAKLLFGYDSPAAFTFVAYGTGTTAFSTSQTALVTEVECKAATKIELTSTAMYNDTLRYTTRFTATTAEKVISEVGVFNLVSAGDMLMRKVISPAVTVPSGKIPVIVVDFQLSDSEAAT